MEKKELRQKILTQRNNLAPSTVHEKSRQIINRLLALPIFSTAKTILTYLSIKNEPKTLILLEKAWQQKKQVLVPVTNKKTKTLILSELKNWEELCTGIGFIPEPQTQFLRPYPPEKVELCLLPGLAFDHNGNRLGYGGGYFDRLLTSLSPTCPKIALAYDFQVFSSIPTAEHDQPVNLIITETQTRYCPPISPF